MNDDERWERYFFADHTRAELAEWVQRLSFFRFCRAHGGHANDCDQLLTALRVESPTDLVDIYSALGIPDKRVPKNAPQPIPYKPYSSEEFDKFAILIPGYPTMEQPGWVLIAGERIFASVLPGKPYRLTLSVSSQTIGLAVTEEVVEIAQRVEVQLLPFATRIIDSPIDERRCLSPKWQPEFWVLPGQSNWLSES